MVQLEQPVEDGFDNETRAVPETMCEIARSLQSEHPPTNPNILIGLIDYWNDISTYNDPIVKTAVAWLDYLLHEDVSQLEAGLTMQSHEELVDRLDELGILREDDE